MKACIYARTSYEERGDNTTRIERQISECRALAIEHGLQVPDELVFTDVQMGGELAPTLWVSGDDEGRPALSAVLDAILSASIERIVVYRLEKLATSSQVLSDLRDFFLEHDVHVIVARDKVEKSDDPRAGFAAKILRPVIQMDSDVEIERRKNLRLKKAEEVERLRKRIHRLEQEIAEL